MDADRLSLLHEDYRDTCASLAEHRGKRDRYFYLVLAVLAVALFDVTAPDGFATAIADILKAQLGLSAPPNLAYIRSLLWLLLLGLTIRYGQAALGVERLYIYLHDLEDALAAQVPGAFRREGKAYAEYNPPFMTWAHWLYTIIFPVLLACVVVVWTWQQIPGSPWRAGWRLSVVFNSWVSIAILASIAMYLHAFHVWKRRPA
jgi:hypothetical protein